MPFRGVEESLLTATSAGEMHLTHGPVARGIQKLPPPSFEPGCNNEI